jgi:hypothetical protein
MLVGAKISCVLHISSDMTQTGQFLSTGPFSITSGSLWCTFFNHAQGKTGKIRKINARTRMCVWSDLPFFLFLGNSLLSTLNSQQHQAGGCKGNTVLLLATIERHLSLAPNKRLSRASLPTLHLCKSAICYAASPMFKARVQKNRGCAPRANNNAV